MYNSNIIVRPMYMCMYVHNYVCAFNLQALPLLGCLSKWFPLVLVEVKDGHAELSCV